MIKNTEFQVKLKLKKKRNISGKKHSFSVQFSIYSNIHKMVYNVQNLSVKTEKKRSDV